MPKTLPRELTSYDLLKALALILMLCDHVGHHFYPDEMWFRAVGRLCLPIWFFLIGYSKTTEMTRILWGGAVIVFASALISGQLLLPINILFTILIIRYLRDGMGYRTFSSPEALRGMFLILFFMTFPTAIFFEYGTAAFMLALIGYLVRHKVDIKEKIKEKYLVLYTFLTLLSFFLMQGISMPSLSVNQALFMLGGFTVIGLILWRFKPVVYTDAEKVMSRSFIRGFQFMGRRTLEIYVVHLVLLRFICMYLYPDKYSLWAWEIAPMVLL